MNDLYQPSPSDNVVTAPTTQANSFDIGGILDGFNIGQLVMSFAYIALLWTIVLNMVLIYDFLFFHIRNGWGELERERPAVESLRKARRMWITYLLTWPFLALFWMNPGGFSFVWGVLALIVYAIKIVLLDATVVPVYSNLLGGLTDIFGAPLKEIPGKITPKPADVITGITNLVAAKKPADDA